MKLHDDYYEEEHSSGSKMVYVYMALVMSVVILGVTALVFWANQSKSKSDGSGYAAALAQKEAKAAETSKQMEANAAENVISGHFRTLAGTKVQPSQTGIMAQSPTRRQGRLSLTVPQTMQTAQISLRLLTRCQTARLRFMI